jgi:NADH-quinone oxidoreductase subunit D
MSRVVIPIGPQHPSLEEPACFTITLEGENVVNAVVGIGYNHRGLEKACESRTYVQNIYLIERVCGICSHTHSTAYCQAVEELAGVEIPRRAAYIRTLTAELERIHSHLLWLGVAGHEIGFNTLFMYSWRDRERILDVLAMLGGNRVNYGLNTIGGVRRDLLPEHIEAINNAIDYIEEQIKYYTELAMEDVTLAARLSGVGKLSNEDAIRFGSVGPVARASNVSKDIRKDDPYAAYGDIPFKVVTDDRSDVFGRTVVRIGEISESCNIIRYCLKNIPDGDILAKVPRKIPAGETLSRTEAPRGENIHYMRANGTDKPDRIRVRAPSEANWHAMKHMLESNYLADVPIIIAAIDPCYSCTDRAILVNRRDSGDQSVFDWNSLRRYSIEWYKKKGIDAGSICMPKA